MAEPSEGGKHVKLTIGICAFNEERNIRQLLSDVLSQTNLPKDFQVIVVASGCTDNTPAIIREVAKEHDRVQLIEETKRSGKTGAINHILAKCESEVLALVDADIRLPRDCINEILRGFSDEEICVVGAAPVVANPEDGPVAESASIIWRVMSRALRELSMRGELSYVMGEMYCFRTRLVGKIPNEIVNDDAYVATRARSKGLKVILAPRANFVTRVPSSIPDYVALRRRVTFGHAQIKAQMGKFATSMEGMALEHTSTLMRAMIREAASRPSSIIRALLLLELEVVCISLALLDLMVGRKHVIY